MNSYFRTAIVLFSTASAAFCATDITFEDKGAFDQAGPGESIQLEDNGTTFTLTTVDIVGTDLRSAVEKHAKHLTSVSTGQNEFGINSQGDEQSATSFEAGEAWIAKFSTDICIDSIYVVSLEREDALSLTVLDGSNNGAGQTFPLKDRTNRLNITLPANTPFKISAGPESGNVRFSKITVSATAPAN